MPWIETISESEADEQLKKMYMKLIEKRGKIANILKIQSLLPETIEDHLQLYLHIMFNRSSLRREDKELIAVFVSSLNNCKYCIHHHAEALNVYWKDKEKLQDFLETVNTDILSEKQKAMLKYAEKLTHHPDRVKKEDIDQLRKSGLTDKEILEVALIVSYFNFVNRMALGLNVTFTDKEMKGYKY